MFGGRVNLDIDLDPVKKLELGVVAVIFLVAGFFVVRNWSYWSGRTIDGKVISWVLDRSVGIDPTRPIGRNNPKDTSTKVLATFFAGFDGKLEIVESTKDEVTTTMLKFTPDPRPRKYNQYENHWDKLASSKDPARRMIAYSAYRMVTEGQSGRLLGAADAGLTTEQRQAELDARHALKDRVVLIESGARDGTADPKLYAAFTQALQAYRDMPGDPSKDAAKGAAAARVMEAGLAYVGKIQVQTTDEVQKYIDKVYGVLDAEQRKRMVEAATRLAAQGRLFPKTS